MSAAGVDELRLDDQLCFALYAASHAIVRSYRPRLARIGLTYPQYLVMLALWQDGPASVGDVARRLDLDSHAVSPLVDRLEGAGLVRRRRGVDRRRMVLETTAAGRDLEPLAAAVQRDVQCDTGLDPTELAALRTRLRDLAGRLADAPDDPPARSPRAGRDQPEENRHDRHP